MRRRAGQAFVESVFVVMLLVAVFVALANFSELLTARLALGHAARCAARCRAVGFNRHMVGKTALAAAIPGSGRCLVKGTDGGTLSPAAQRARVGEYLQAEYENVGRGMLDYEFWNDTHVEINESGGDVALVTVRLEQRRPSRYDGEQITLGGGARPAEASVENHYSLYMTDEGL